MMVIKSQIDVSTAELRTFNRVMVLGTHEHRVGLKILLYFSNLFVHGSFFSLRSVIEPGLLIDHILKNAD